VLIAYGDDSSDSKQKLVFTAAALLGSESDWQAFELEWLKRNGERPFHATDCDSDRGDFADTSHEDNKLLYSANVRHIARSPLMGAALSISIKDFVELFPTSVGEWPFYLCFSSAVSAMADFARVSIPPDTVSITFDQNAARAYNSTVLYDYMMKQAEWRLGGVLHHSIIFADHRLTVGIQVADLIAREAMKDLENQLKGRTRGRRHSLKELLMAKRIRFRWFDRERLEVLHRRTQEVPDNSAVNRVYSQWRESRGLADNIPVRLQFLTAPDVEPFIDDEARKYVEQYVSVKPTES
jgi:hypothetical protein